MVRPDQKCQIGQGLGWRPSLLGWRPLLLDARRLTKCPEEHEEWLFGVSLCFVVINGCHLGKPLYNSELDFVTDVVVVSGISVYRCVCFGIVLASLQM